MHLQKAVDPYDQFVRVIGFGPRLRAIRYDPAQPCTTATPWTRTSFPPTTLRRSRT
jgi:hypothetical protein